MKSLKCVYYTEMGEGKDENQDRYAEKVAIPNILPGSE